MLRVKPRGTLGHSSFTEGRTQDASLWPEARLKGAHRELARPEVASTTLKKGLPVSPADRPGEGT